MTETTNDASSDGSPGSEARTERELLCEIRQRLIHIEQKTDALARLGSSTTVPAAKRGHPDQAFGNITYAQFGEDLLILNLFHLLGVRHPSYIDIGAHHPFNISNTALLYERGSRGINIEPNPNLIGEFQHCRPQDINLNIGVGPASGTLDFYFIDDWSGRNTFVRQAAEEFVKDNPLFRIQDIRPLPVLTLNEIVARYASGRFPDFLNIDAEGLDIEILQSTSFEEDRPLVICVEAISGGDHDSSLLLAQLLQDRMYYLHIRTVGNLIFVHHAARHKLGITGMQEG